MSYNPCSGAVPRKTSPSTTPPAVFSRKSSPGTPQTDVFGPFFVRWANFFALTPTIRPSRANFFAHRTRDMATLKPTTPLRPLMQTNVKPPSPLQPLMQTNVKPPSPMLAPEQRALKPPSPLQPKNAPKTPISHPQRRCRFQSHTRTSEQRRWRFQLGASKGDAGFTREIYDARGLWRSLAGHRVNAPSHISATRHHWCGGHRRDPWAWLRRPWAVAGPGRASSRRAERSSRRGRRAGGPPPTGTSSSPARQGSQTKTSGTGRRHDPRLGRQGTQP